MSNVYEGRATVELASDGSLRILLPEGILCQRPSDGRWIAITTTGKSIECQCAAAGYEILKLYSTSRGPKIDIMVCAVSIEGEGVSCAISPDIDKGADVRLVGYAFGVMGASVNAACKMAMYEFSTNPASLVGFLAGVAEGAKEECGPDGPNTVYSRSDPSSGPPAAPGPEKRS